MSEKSTSPEPPRAVPMDQVREAHGEKIVPVPLDKVRSVEGKKLVPVPRSKVAATRAFRRVRADRVAGLAGVALVALAALLLFTWPQPAIDKPPAFTVEWPENEFAVFHDNVTVTRAENLWQQDLEIEAPNITRVILFINVQDDFGDELAEQDNLSVELIGPEGSNATLRLLTSAGPEATNMSLPAVVTKLPDIREVPATTEVEARERLGDHTTRNGTGTWRLSIRLLYAGDDYHGDAGNVTRGDGQSCPAQTPPQGTAVCTPDPGNAVEVRVSYRSYSVVLTPPSD